MYPVTIEVEKQCFNKYFSKSTIFQMRTVRMLLSVSASLTKVSKSIKEKQRRNLSSEDIYIYIYRERERERERKVGKIKYHPILKT